MNRQPILEPALPMAQQPVNPPLRTRPASDPAIDAEADQGERRREQEEQQQQQ